MLIVNASLDFSPLQTADQVARSDSHLSEHGIYLEIYLPDFLQYAEYLYEQAPE